MANYFLLRNTVLNLLLVIALLTGCTSGPELKKLPRTQIERPYTLPKGVTTWTTLLPTGYFSDDTGSSFLPPIPVPLYWESSLSDNWTLTWSPLPMSVSHQFSYSETQVWGTSFGVGGGYASSHGLILAPFLSFYQRYRIGSTWALETTPSFSGQYHSKGDPWEWSVGLSSGPLFQITEHFALAPKAGIYIERGYRNSISVTDISVEPEKSTQVTVPLSLTAEWSFHRQWDLEAKYNFNRIGHTKGYTSHVGRLVLVHYW